MSNTLAYEQSHSISPLTTHFRILFYIKHRYFFFLVHDLRTPPIIHHVTILRHLLPVFLLSHYSPKSDQRGTDSKASLDQTFIFGTAMAFHYFSTLLHLHLELAKAGRFGEKLWSRKELFSDVGIGVID